MLEQQAPDSPLKATQTTADAPVQVALACQATPLQPSQHATPNKHTTEAVPQPKALLEAADHNSVHGCKAVICRLQLPVRVPGNCTIPCTISCKLQPCRTCKPCTCQAWGPTPQWAGQCTLPGCVTWHMQPAGWCCAATSPCTTVTLAERSTSRSTHVAATTTHPQCASSTTCFVAQRSRRHMPRCGAPTCHRLTAFHNGLHKSHEDVETKQSTTALDVGCRGCKCNKQTQTGLASQASNLTT